VAQKLSVSHFSLRRVNPHNLARAGEAFRQYLRQCPALIIRAFEQFQQMLIRPSSELLGLIVDEMSRRLDKVQKAEKDSMGGKRRLDLSTSLVCTLLECWALGRVPVFFDWSIKKSGVYCKLCVAQ